MDKSLFDVRVEGEVSNLTIARSGHWYFSLKDNNAQIRCAIFRNDNRHCRTTIHNGQQILAHGKITVYEPRGDLQFIADMLEPAGTGKLQLAYETLKAKLAAEGLFDLSRKRTLPKYPQTIGIVTSPTGAAIKDVLTVLKRRWPLAQIVIYPTEVQGTTAAKKIMAAIELANQRNEVDVLLVTRGGGSIEDLWCFNDEQLARTLAASKLITVSAIGHEIDTTLCDWVADHRSPTPSAAAEQLVPDSVECLLLLQTTQRRLVKTIHGKLSSLTQQFDRTDLRLMRTDPARKLDDKRRKLQSLNYKLTTLIVARQQADRRRLEKLLHRLAQANPVNQLTSLKYTLYRLENTLYRVMKYKLDKAQHQLHTISRTLDALSPLATLNRGYAIVYDPQGRVISRHTAVKPDDVLSIQLSDGRIYVQVVRDSQT